MNLDLDQFFQACNPAERIDMKNPDDRRYYIDFAAVRGGKAIDALKRTITRLSPYSPTCQLFTGHIGCGKSTELSRLETELLDAGFHVVYFRATEDLDVADVDITDILLAIARQIGASLEENQIKLQPKGFKAFLKKTTNFLGTIEFSGAEFSLPGEIAKITFSAKDSQQIRSRLRQYLEPQTNQILKYINDEIVKTGIEQLKQLGKKGLVMIVDNLDRIENQPTSSSNKPLPEYIFVDRGEQLRQINCHLIYTLPMSLIYSNESEAMQNRLGGGVGPKVLPMVPVKLRDGRDCVEGMDLLRQMVLARAFPELPKEQRIELIAEVFDSAETLDRLCRISGGHVRTLLGILYGCLQVEDPPISAPTLEFVILGYRDSLLKSIDNQEWELLFEVDREPQVKGEGEYQTLLRSLFVFEYHDEKGTWFGLNPLLFETEKYQSWKQENSGS